MGERWVGNRLYPFHLVADLDTVLSQDLVSDVLPHIEPMHAEQLRNNQALIDVAH